MARFKIEIGKWTEYRPDASLELPSNARQEYVWTSVVGASSSVAVVACTSGSVPNEYCLDMSSELVATGDSVFFASSDPNSPIANFSYINGYTIEAKVKVVSAGSNGAHFLYFRDNLYNEFVHFYPDRIELGKAGTTYPMDTTIDFNTYRVLVKDSNLQIFVNNIERINGALASTTTVGSPSIRIGENAASVSSYGGQSLWGVIKYRADGAYLPVQKPGDGWYYSNFDDADRRRIKKKGVIRSDNNIIPEGKMQPKRLKVKGTIAGSCWNSYRSTVRRLKNILNGGTQRIMMDEERFIDGLHSNFTLKPKTQDFAEFNASFECRYPYFQELWASYVSTAPVSAATFYVNNDSDIEIPCKIIVTGAATGTIDNDIQIDNTTLNQQAKFVGVLAATQELTIDKGFKTYNDYDVNVDGAASFGSYEGDLFTLAPGSNSFVFTGGAVGTIEVYWRESTLL